MMEVSKMNDLMKEKIISVVMLAWVNDKITNYESDCKDMNSEKEVLEIWYKQRNRFEQAITSVINGLGSFGEFKKK